MQNFTNNPDKTDEQHLNQYQPNMPRFSVYEIENYLKKYDKKRRKAHSKNYYQIIWFKNGNGRYFVDYKGFDVIENTLFFVTKEQVHYFDKNTHYSGVLIQFNEQFLIQNNNDADFLLKYDLFKKLTPPYINLDRDDLFVLDEYLNLIKNELNNKNKPYQAELVRNYLKVFLIQLQHKWNKLNTSMGHHILPGDKKQLKLAKFLNLIEDNFKKELNVSEYARIMQISSRTLSDLTSQLLDKSPSQLIHERIIDEAQKMLLNTNFSINKIGYNLGFNDDSYFVKYFKKHTNISPLDFRNFYLHSND
ncbi:hypothetical protein B0A67_00775 [Flavobacterium aquidurense]|jgi:AraC family transcriptional activator of pobA|uniref:AraC family transcriptional regulator n=1 Tax=Flavobacterium aquidurense TaxID=362413 RepID=UPI000910B3DC|nr:AraC family transcriptional regulator [Flavobacterium aquidurense]OXA74347.1 hypothetical protein B0A67_00775 [Flavobacterium aquidurense]SHF93503.1 AraC-type DNA-binding protein [Flavobacterium frigidimaris]